MKTRVIMDTGPLVAFLNRKDRYHAWVEEQLAEIVPPLLTCEAVLSESCFLLRDIEGGSNAVFELINRGLVSLSFDLKNEFEAIRKLMARFSNLPMSLADACLVRMSEQFSKSTVLTLDSDFQIYRKHGRKVIPLIMPDDLKMKKRKK
jgi:predicted nucleic acid-binding protein